ncbi:spermatogenesis-associated protein 17-like [Amphibalanus amphitrite]|uniref:spermatogenesis-associated protein 17-like n=1 Tax=Amphibalanus amphitrite TaxID=1232801 RepID=UPI001C8FED63|nr:spermatogenesis-associated protein 17-like [Amphibalanus amphitrite]
MTTYQRLVVQLDTFPELVVLRHHEADTDRAREYRAAVRLQSWVRGYRIRDRLRRLHQLAAVIQRHWRGYLGRRYYRRLLQETVLRAQADYYRRQATLIQKTWRGFRSRLFVFNFAEWKGYLNFVADQNDELRVQCALECRRLSEERKTVCSSEILQQKTLIKTHHMISTKTIPGVYNSPYHRERIGIEKHLASIRFPVRPTKKPKTKPEDKVEDDKSAWGASKLQGPFLPPLELRRRLSRRPCQSLRTAEPFENTEAAVRDQRRLAKVHCVSEQPFRPPTAHLLPPLLSSVHASVPYRPPPPFRETDSSRFVGSGDFRRVLRPVETFDGCV